MEKLYHTRVLDHKVYRRLVKSLNEKAMNENKTWKKFEGKYNKALLLVDGNTGWTPVGYLMWTGKRKKVILNQIYIKENYRRQGAASFLLQDWYNQITAKRHRKMYIESPSSELLQLLIKIGYAHMDGGRCISDKFSIARPYVYIPKILGLSS